MVICRYGAVQYIPHGRGSAAPMGDEQESVLIFQARVYTRWILSRFVVFFFTRLWCFVLSTFSKYNGKTKSKICGIGGGFQERNESILGGKKTKSDETEPQLSTSRAEPCFPAGQVHVDHMTTKDVMDKARVSPRVITQKKKQRNPPNLKTTNPEALMHRPIQHRPNLATMSWVAPNDTLSFEGLIFCLL